ncbi:MAG TPA: hypothetical protein DD379_24805 [Cyanobacteria bacterium UBA11162]|nr:hypothetical protein [Cyanobacteria bacterium UBA11162]
MKPWPPPPIQQFERLKVTDGLLINAQRWQLAHQYHRHYHNAYYQSLHQPGIVCGLEVRITSAPAEVTAKFRDDRWVEIQPGIGIDLFGNFIVVPKAETYRIASEVATEEPLMVYLVARFRDPDELKTRRTDERVTETFRIDEKTTPPSQGDVELCRILLKPGKVQLENSKDVFFPSYNNLDLRYRLQAQSRPQTIVQVATYKKPTVSSQDFGSLMIPVRDDSEQDRIVSNLTYLLQSVGGLYPHLQGSDEIGQLTLQPTDGENVFDYDLIFLSDRQWQSLNDPEIELLRKYVESGGVLLVEASTQGTAIEELTNVKQELDKAIADIGDDLQLWGQRQELEAEREAIATDLAKEISNITQLFQDLTSAWETPLESLEQLNRNHPLRTKPFLFSALPSINQQPIQLLIGGGIIVIVGSLSSAWGLDENLSVSRETIRTAQEMGINILHYAWRRRQLMGSQRLGDTMSSISDQPQSSKRTARDRLFDQLGDDQPSKPSKPSRRDDLFDKLS